MIWMATKAAALAFGKQRLEVEVIDMGIAAPNQWPRIVLKDWLLGLEVCQARLAFELGVEAQRRERPLAGGTDQGALARTTMRW